MIIDLEADGSLLLERTKINFVLNKAFFAAGCGQSGEKNNAVQCKIWQEQPKG
jgi:hypothetical protein